MRLRTRGQVGSECQIHSTGRPDHAFSNMKDVNGRKTTFAVRGAGEGN